MEENVVATWLIYKATLFNFLISKGEALDKKIKINLQYKYFRFSRMHYRNPCVVLLLFTTYVNESALTLTNSVFGTSEHALAFQFVDKLIIEN